MRKEFLSGCKTALLVMVLSAALVVGFLWHQQTPQVERVHVPIAGLPPAWQGARIGLISDLHIGAQMNDARVKKVVRRLNAQKPDIIVIAGDTVDAKVTQAAEAAPALQALHALKAPFGVYHIFGNHDARRADLWRPLLREAGIRVLENEHARLRKAGDTLYLVGLADAINGRPDASRAWQGIPQEAFVIAAVHEPDVADELVGLPLALQLSGHSHGGQIVLPFNKPLSLPPLGRKYPAGLYETDAGHLVYATRGVGTSQVPFRLFARPEITIIILEEE